jgi:peptidyl-prolyl cis-trans isomerase A (cyclophilin A)
MTGVPVAEKLYATLHTNHGPIRVQLFPDHAPATVRNFVELAEGTKDYTDPRTGQKGNGPYYNGTISHRVISGFMVQMGDPTGTGRGGPGFQFADEFHPDLQFDRPYLLAMANAGPGTNGSQFFIVLADAGLPPNYSVFGRVTSGMDVVDKIAAMPNSGSPENRATNPVAMTKVTVATP